MVKPGGKIGAMTLEQGAPALVYPYLWQFCENIPDNHSPAQTASECKTPRLSGMTVNLGWLARESKLEDNWENILWELTIDGEMIDLASFRAVRARLFCARGGQQIAAVAAQPAQLDARSAHAAAEADDENGGGRRHERLPAR